MKSVQDLSTKVTWMEEEVSNAWKKGCPVNGVSNGTACFVLYEEKLNYTDAVDSCISKVSFCFIIISYKFIKTILFKIQHQLP